MSHYRYLTRFKEAPATNPGVRDFTEQIVTWFDEWLVGLSSNLPFQDECTTYEADKREFIIENLQRDKERILCIIQHGKPVIKDDEMSMPYELPNGADFEPVAILEQNVDHDGSGDFFATAPRHDNDFPEIEKIRVAPTRNELLCENSPYLPPNFFEAPHFHDPKSIDRLLDIQFRLLREELMSVPCESPKWNNPPKWNTHVFIISILFLCTYKVALSLSCYIYAHL